MSAELEKKLLLQSLLSSLPRLGFSRAFSSSRRGRTPSSSRRFLSPPPPPLPNPTLPMAARDNTAVPAGLADGRHRQCPTDGAFSPYPPLSPSFLVCCSLAAQGECDGSASRAPSHGGIGPPPSSVPPPIPVLA